MSLSTLVTHVIVHTRNTHCCPLVTHVFDYTQCGKQHEWVDNDASYKWADNGESYTWVDNDNGYEWVDNGDS